jgi:hypothetical protein
MLIVVMLALEFMTATDLSKLADLIEEDSLPLWLRKQIEEGTANISQALEQGRSVTLCGPQGEKITIGPGKKIKTAAA